MLLDAIVLAGGRSSRLSGVPKSELVWQGRTLLQTAVSAVTAVGALRVVVVGPHTLDLGAIRGVDIVTAREDPPFGGPAAAIGAGLNALSVVSLPNAEAVIVLACDMPRVMTALVSLVEAIGGPNEAVSADRDGAIIVDAQGHRQPLAAIYGRAALVEAVERLRAEGRLDGGSMRSLIERLNLTELNDPEGRTRDVDTWSDAARFGIRAKSTT